MLEVAVRRAHHGINLQFAVSGLIATWMMAPAPVAARPLTSREWFLVPKKRIVSRNGEHGSIPCTRSIYNSN
jgi:hypothetical protein